MRARLLRFDGQVGAVVNAEKQVVDPAVAPGKLAEQLERIAQQMGLSPGGAAEQSGKDFVLEPAKPGFTRVAGSIRRQVPPQEIRESKE
ncbi:MAG: hypothetical protein LC808_28695 [Actinobacteria bacterium]|nr:hypothetical protein [Actinomycetota bacterium]